MTIEARTVQPKPKGQAKAGWTERFGPQYVTVTVDPERRDPDAEVYVLLERKWGPQIGDHRRQDFRFSRAGAEVLRDALNAALTWTPDDEAVTTDDHRA